MKIKISLLFDVIISFLMLFVLMYCWINFYTKSIILSIFLGILISFFVIFVVFFCKFKFLSKKQISLLDQTAAEDQSLQFQFSENQKILDFFESILKQKYKLKREQNFFILETKNAPIIFYQNFNEDLFLLKDLSYAFCLSKKYNISNIIICAKAFDDKCKHFAQNIKNVDINLLDQYQTYSQIIKPSNQKFEQSVNTSKLKPNLKQLFKFAINKKRTKNYVLMGLVLIVSSFFVLYKTYYLITGSVLLIMAIITRVLPNKAPSQTNIL